MPIKAVVENLDDVAEALRDEYQEKEGKFYLNIEGVDDHPTVRNLKSAHEKTKKERLEFMEKLKAAGERLEHLPEDFDPDEYARLLAEEQARKDNPDDKDKRKEIEAAREAISKQWEQKIIAAEKKWRKEVEGRDEKIVNLDTRLRRRYVEDDLTKALIDAGVTDADMLAGAKAILRDQIEVVEEDGEYAARMKAEFGGDDVFRGAAAWVQTDRGKKYIPQAQGAGAGGSQKKPGTVSFNPWAKETLNMTEQGKIIRADKAKAARLMRDAGRSENEIRRLGF